MDQSALAATGQPQSAVVLGQPHQVVIAAPAALAGGAGGGALGGWLLRRTDPSIFEQLVPWLVLLATLLLALEDRIKTAVGRLSRHHATAARRGSEGGSDAALAGVVFAGALYGGFFGAGLGSSCWRRWGW